MKIFLGFMAGLLIGSIAPAFCKLLFISISVVVAALITVITVVVVAGLAFLFRDVIASWAKGVFGFSES